MTTVDLQFLPSGHVLFMTPHWRYLMWCHIMWYSYCQLTDFYLFLFCSLFFHKSPVGLLHYTYIKIKILANKSSQYSVSRAPFGKANVFFATPELSDGTDLKQSNKWTISLLEHPEIVLWDCVVEVLVSLNPFVLYPLCSTLSTTSHCFRNRAQMTPVYEILDCLFSGLCLHLKDSPDTSARLW